MKPNRRQKLNLTISKRSRKAAEELAEKQHRSISNLFEHLVDEEAKRIRAADELAAAFNAGLSGDQPFEHATENETRLA